MPLITIVNASQSLPRLVLFRRSNGHPSLGAAVWRLIRRRPRAAVASSRSRAPARSPSPPETPKDPRGPAGPGPRAAPPARSPPWSSPSPRTITPTWCPIWRSLPSSPRPTRSASTTATRARCGSHLRQGGGCVYPPQLVAPGDAPAGGRAADGVGFAGPGGGAPRRRGATGDELHGSAGDGRTDALVSGSRMGGLLPRRVLSRAGRAPQTDTRRSLADGRTPWPTRERT